MGPRELAEACLDALGRADLTMMLSLFSDGALVHSPLYGAVPASEFFPSLFGDTAESRLTLRGVTQGEDAGGTPLVSIWSHFDWQRPIFEQETGDASGGQDTQPVNNFRAQ
jgi:hypothetical protein